MKSPEELYKEHYKGFITVSVADAYKKGFLRGVNIASDEYKQNEGREMKITNKMNILKRKCNDVECPYCGAEQAINHDDDYGYEEDQTHEQQCGDCEKFFAYTTTSSFLYTIYAANCLNGADHKYKSMTPPYYEECTEMKCTDCGKRRKKRIRMDMVSNLTGESP